jgi:hypothetical protein
MYISEVPLPGERSLLRPLTTQQDLFSYDSQTF